MVAPLSAAEEKLRAVDLAACLSDLQAQVRHKPLLEVRELLLRPLGA
jgi:hypothetical protein